MVTLGFQLFLPCMISLGNKVSLQVFFPNRALARCRPKRDTARCHWQREVISDTAPATKGNGPYLRMPARECSIQMYAGRHGACERHGASFQYTRY